jgi:hypothetical protein
MDINHPQGRLRVALDMATPLVLAAEATVRAAQRAHARATRKASGATLRPGPRSPLWNELARTVHAHATRYGDKAKLSRILGVPRQRVDDYLVGHRRMPDAERTLLLLQWLATRQAGSDIV